MHKKLTELAINLYKEGPEQRNIWERAGGDISKLTNHVSREENWQKAIDLLNLGGGGNSIKAYTLLEQMQEDYPNNKDLKTLVIYFNELL